MLDKYTLQEWMSENGGYVLHDPLHKGVFTGYVRFTPERAELALENNLRNRKPGFLKQIPILVEVLTKGLWNDNVSKINFDKDGVLSDGQNRLMACIKADRALRCLVTYGVSKDAQLVTDRRGARIFHEDLTIDGFKNAKRLASITRIFYLKENGTSVKTLLQRNGETSYSTSDISLYKFFTSNADELIETEKYVNRIYSSVRDLHINNFTIAVLAAEFRAINEEDAHRFWERLSNGITTMEDDPVIRLRRRLLANSDSKIHKLPVTVEAALIIKAWNAYMKGEPVKQLKYVAGGGSPEPFPEIYNPYSES